MIIANTPVRCAQRMIDSTKNSRSQWPVSLLLAYVQFMTRASFIEILKVGL